MSLWDLFRSSEHRARIRRDAHRAQLKYGDQAADKIIERIERASLERDRKHWERVLQELRNS